MTMKHTTHQNKRDTAKAALSRKSFVINAYIIKEKRYTKASEEEAKMAHYKKLSAKEGSNRENEEQKGLRHTENK